MINMVFNNKCFRNINKQYENRYCPSSANQDSQMLILKKNKKSQKKVKYQATVYIKKNCKGKKKKKI